MWHLLLAMLNLLGHAGAANNNAGEYMGPDERQAA